MCLTRMVFARVVGVVLTGYANFCNVIEMWWFVSVKGNLDITKGQYDQETFTVNFQTPIP